MASKSGKEPAFSNTSAYCTIPFLSITNAERFETPFIHPLKLSYKQPNKEEASLLKSLNKEKFKCCTSLNFANVCGESTEMPKTFAFALLYTAILSLTLHNSFVQTLVKANGKNNNNTLFPFCSDSETSFFSESCKVKSGASLPV